MFEDMVSMNLEVAFGRTIVHNSSPSSKPYLIHGFSTWFFNSASRLGTRPSQVGPILAGWLVRCNPAGVSFVSNLIDSPGQLGTTSTRPG